jgi:Cytosol aminopeptidase family, N-terminal domain
MSLLAPSLATLDGLGGAEALALFLADDERPLSGAAGFLDWRLGGELSRVLKAGFFVGAAGERLLVPTFGAVPATKAFAFGLGRGRSVTALGLEHALADAAGALKRAQVASVGLAFGVLPSVPDEAKLELVKRAFAPAFGGAWFVFASEG